MVPANLTLQVRDGNDGIVFQRQQQIPVTTFSSQREAIVLVDVPVRQMAAGEYLLTIEASSGSTTARRESRFHVVR